MFRQPVLFRVICYLLFIPLSMCGAVGLWDSYNVVQLPTVRRCPPEILSKTTDFPRNKNPPDEKYWQEIQPALGLLDHCCPAVSEWVRSKYQQNKIQWTKGPKDHYAACYIFNGWLEICTEAFFPLGHVGRACILAHEYRHSIQGTLPRSLGYVTRLWKSKQFDWIETEAMEFEFSLWKSLVYHETSEYDY